MSTASFAFPFSHPMSVADIGQNGTPFTCAITPKDAEAIAAFLGVQKIAKFAFSGVATSQDAGIITVTGRLGVTVTQECVVTLKPVRTRIDTDVERIFSPNPPVYDEDRQLLEDEATIDPLVDPIDLGLIALEDIALSIPAYPRATDADLEVSTFSGPGVAPLRDEDIKPFASLAALRDKLESDEKN